MPWPGAPLLRLCSTPQQALASAEHVPKVVTHWGGDGPRGQEAHGSRITIQGGQPWPEMGCSEVTMKDMLLSQGAAEPVVVLCTEPPWKWQTWRDSMGSS